MNRRRWGLGVAVVVAAAGLGGATWRATGWHGLPDAASAAAPAPVVVPPVAGASTPGAALAPHAPAAAPPAAIDVLAQAAAPGPGLGDEDIPPEGVEFCGVGTVTAADLRQLKADPARGEAWAADMEAQLKRRTDAALAQMATRLAAGGEAQQVAARLLMGDTEGAAALAGRASDASAYQLALTACRGPGASSAAPSCAGLTAQRWAALDPSDARPWLRQLDEARRRNDPAAVDALLAEAAARPRLSRGNHLLEAHAVQVAELVPDVAARGHVLVQVIGMDGAMPGLDIAALSRPCSAEGLQRPQRLPHCRAVARQVLAATGDLMEAALAQRLAERAGVPAEQQAHDGATLKAATKAAQEQAFRGIGVDCASMRHMAGLSAQRAARGDLAMALALLPPR